MPDVSFYYPQALVLLLLLPLAWRYLAGRRRAVSSWLRLGMAFLAILALARPRLAFVGGETDLVIVVDRSASCGGEADRMLRELLPLARRGEKPGDHTAVVAFGNGTAVERGFAADVPGMPLPEHFEQASDLAAGLRLAAAIRAPNRRTAILCLSDGLYTGESPLSPDILSALSGMPVWHRRLGDDTGTDVAAGAISLPEEVEPRSAWLVRFVISASAPVETEYAISRNGFAIAGGRVVLRRGDNNFFVRDTVDEDLALEYRLDTRTEGDRLRENDSSRAVLRVRSAPRALVVSHADQPGLLTESLRAAAIPVDIIDPADFPRTGTLLAPYRLIILENARLSDFSGRGVASLAATVETGLASLLVTGGPNSFGMGGYHRSAIDPLLPVEMELRNDLRRGSMAIAIAMDRSGSMAIDAGEGSGQTKMDLANLGAAEAIRLLAPRDQVSVIAVDSAPKVVVPLSMADNVEALADLTLAIQPMGGGIYTYSALVAAAEEVRKSPLPNRHILLFADADDAEEQDGCFDLADELLREKIRISVVAMGDEDGSDAQFLIDLATRGGGKALFSNHAAGLPALFTQEIMRISRRGFLEERVTPRLLSSMHLLGLEDLSRPPWLAGYNVSALREGAVAFMNIDDEFSTPLLATRTSGRAAAGAVLFEVEGEFSGAFTRWSETPPLLTALARRLAGGVHPAGVKAYSSLDKGVAEVVYEFSPEAARLARGGDASVRWLGPDGIVLTNNLEWIESARARARTQVTAAGHYLPVADLGQLGVAAAPSVSLPYSAEFALHERGQGRRRLENLADLTGGGDGLDISQVRASATATQPGTVDLRPWLALALIILFLVELSGRRILWFR